MDIPKIIFIVPYRNREQHQLFFSKQMKYVLEDISNYKILYIHQKDQREFNRGAMKNIGLLVIKDLYPNDYKNINLVFNDVDTMPFTKNFLNYFTKPNIVKHFYGFRNTLGGIVSIMANDFENINGFPNFWSWGYEDNELQNRVLHHKMTIDRSQFYPILDKNILMLTDGIHRIVNKDDFKQYRFKTKEGIDSIKNLKYEINGEFVDVTNFDTGREENKYTKSSYDLRKGNKIFSKKSNMSMSFN